MRRFVMLLAGLVAATLTVPIPPAAAAPRQQSTVLHPDLVAVARVPGVIQDVADTRILYLDPFPGAPALKVRDRGTGADTPVPGIPGQEIRRGWLIPGGVFFGSSANHLYEWRGGDRAVDLGVGFGPVVRGRYAAWSVPPGLLRSSALYRRDFMLGQTVEVDRERNEETSFAEDFELGDIAANGDVVYDDNLRRRDYSNILRSSLKRYHDGTVQEIVGDDGRWARRYPITDGTRIVYRKEELPCRGCEPFTQRLVALHDGTREIDLTEPADAASTSAYLDPGADYDIAGGWTAAVHHRYESGHRADRLWRRGPDGTSTMVAEVVDLDLSIVAIGSDGQLLYSVASRYGPEASLFLSAADRPPVLLAANLGRWVSRYDTTRENFAVRLDGLWHLAIGGTLFALGEGPPVELVVGIWGPGTVTVAPSGETCRTTTCTFRFLRGTRVTLEAATDQPGWRFGGWRGACSGSGPCHLRLLDSTAVRAHFFMPVRTTTTDPAHPVRTG